MNRPPITGEIVAVIGATAVALGCAVKAAAGFNGFDGLGRGVLALAIAAVMATVLRFMKTRRAPGQLAGGRSIAVRGHLHGSGGRNRIATHEAGHVRAARALGGRVCSARVFDGTSGGLVLASIPDTPLAAVTFLAAGRVAAGTGAGAGADDALIRAELRRVPSSMRGQVRRQGYRDAARIVSSGRGQIRRDAVKLAKNGRL